MCDSWRTVNLSEYKEQVAAFLAGNGCQRRCTSTARGWRSVGGAWGVLDHRRYLLNAYRVLLTRARQGPPCPASAR